MHLHNEVKLIKLEIILSEQVVHMDAAKLSFTHWVLSDNGKSCTYKKQSEQECVCLGEGCMCLCAYVYVLLQDYEWAYVCVLD